MAAVLCSMHPKLFAFAVLIGGFRPRDKDLRELFPVPPLPLLGTRSLHIFGTTDTLVPPERSREFADSFEVSQMYEHSRGHLVPSDKEAISVYERFILHR